MCIYRMQGNETFSLNSMTGEITNALQYILIPLNLEASLDAQCMKQVSNPHWPCCANCHGNIHKGGQLKCILKDLPSRKAHDTAQEIQRHKQEFLDQREEIIPQALKHALEK
jgi:hypothetical protein